jgi:hypothetical protein
MLQLILITLLVLFTIGCTEKAPPGLPAVYEQIKAMTDCKELQETFDRNMDDVSRRAQGDSLRTISRSYAGVANERMRDIGCYG